MPQRLHRWAELQAVRRAAPVWREPLARQELREPQVPPVPQAQLVRRVLQERQRRHQARRGLQEPRVPLRYRWLPLRLVRQGWLARRRLPCRKLRNRPRHGSAWRLQACR